MESEKKSPRPNAEVSKQAINQAIDLFHRRWVLRLIWELRGGALTFRQLQNACGEISPTVLNQRLAELRDVRVVAHADGVGYQLTEHGQALLTAMQPLMAWAVSWFCDLAEERNQADSSPSQ